MSNDLSKVYVSPAMLQRELGMAAVTVKNLLAEVEGEPLVFDGRSLYNRAAVGEALRKRNTRLLDFLSALEA